jgi:hypothetical protein
MAYEDRRDLVAIIEQQMSQAIGHMDGQLSESRATEFKYYYGAPFGNEVEGESQVVSTDVADTVEGILPSILRIFTSSDDAVRFDPNGPEDEEQAAQQTEVANYIFYRQNNGFLILYEWFKDALIQKNGIVKYWWEEDKDRSKESYEGLTDGEYQMLLDGDGLAEIEELKHEVYDDPEAIQQKEQMLLQMQQQMQQAQGNPQAMAQMQQAMMQLEQQPTPQLHDVTVRIIKDASKLCIQCIPPEEFGISAKHPCVSIQDTPFCYHRGRRTISQLRADGCPEEILANLSTDDTLDTRPEALARDRYIDQEWPSTINPADPSMREVWVVEAFIRLDEDGDGVAELRHIIMPGRHIWINEETDHINFAAITPIIMPHRWIGRSVSELVMDIQFTKSVIWRQMLNNLYLTNNPRKAVLSSAGGIVQANLDDLLTSRPGGIMREYVPGAIRNEEVPFVAGASFPMLEYMDSLKENRTGNTRYNQGTDADSLNKTARGISLIQSAGQQRLDLIARIFAETGVKDLMKGIVYMMSKYNIKPLTIKLRNKWVNIDPREWKTMLNMTINVGLGTGNRDVQLAHLTQMAVKQNELIQTGRGYMVSDENIYNLYKKTSEAMGFKHPELFISDPSSVPDDAKKPRPDPAMVKVQMEAENDKAKNAISTGKAQLDAETAKAIEQIKAAALERVAMIDSQTKKEVEQMRIRAEAELALFTANNGSPVKDNSAADNALKEWEAKLKAATAIEVAEINKQTTLGVAQINAAVTAASKEEKDSEHMEDKQEKSAQQQKPSVSPVIHVHMPAGKKTISLIKNGDEVVGADVMDS